MNSVVHDSAVPQKTRREADSRPAKAGLKVAIGNGKALHEGVCDDGENSVGGSRKSAREDGVFCPSYAGDCDGLVDHHFGPDRVEPIRNKNRVAIRGLGQRIGK